MLESNRLDMRLSRVASRHLIVACCWEYGRVRRRTTDAGRIGRLDKSEFHECADQGSRSVSFILEMLTPVISDS
jgi:hypothetical protein